VISRLSDLPRPPAYAGFVPTPPVFGPVAPDLAGALAASIPGVGMIEQLSDSSGTAGRFFRAPRGPEGTLLFLKLVSAGEQQAIADADAILSPLAAGGPVVRSCGAFEIADGSRRVAVAYPYLDARFLEPVPIDMGRLGRSIAELHALFHTLPSGDTVKARALERARRLDGVLAGAVPAQLGIALPPSPGIAAAMEGPGAQMLHGDLNVGNILSERESGAIRFLDFEDVRHSFGPPILDLALPIERFCLLLEREADAVACAKALLSGYAEQDGAQPIVRAGALLEALQIVNWRAIALLIERQRAGLETPKSEWGKFGALLRRHAERRALIAAVEQALL
jgi:Ser/Thr protein kinase RdoA (MazF antagonist)